MGQVELTATASYSLGQAILVSVVKAQGKRAQRKVSGRDLGGCETAKGRWCWLEERLVLYRKVKSVGWFQGEQGWRELLH